MRVCVLTRIVSQHGVRGGMEKHLIVVGSGLRARGHDVTVLTTRHPHGVQSEDTEWGRIHYLPRTRPGAYWPRWFDASTAAFTRLHIERPFDIVVSEGAAGEKYAAMKSTRSLPPLVSIMHGTLWGEVANHGRALTSWATFLHAARYLPPMLHHALFWRAYVERADLLIAVGTEVQKRVRREYRVDPSRIEIVFNGIDAERCRFDSGARQRVRELLGVEGRQTLLMTAGRLVPEKGVQLAVEAAQRVTAAGHRIKMAIVGEGPQRAALCDLVNDRGLSDVVVFTGHVPEAQMSGYLSAADLFLMPTLRHEGLPFVLLEAMACARPCIVARFPGLEEIIRHGDNGLTFSPGMPEELASGVVESIQDPLRASRLAQAARRDLEARFTVSRMVSQTVGLMEELVTRT